MRKLTREQIIKKAYMRQSELVEGMLRGILETDNEPNEQDAFAQLLKQFEVHAGARVNRGDETMNKNCVKVLEYAGKLGMLRPGIYRVMGCTVDSTVLSTIDMLKTKTLVATLSIPTLVVLHQDDIIRVNESDGNVTIYKYTNSKFVYSMLNGRLLEYPRLVPSQYIPEEIKNAILSDDNVAIRMAARQGYPVGGGLVKVVSTLVYGSNTVLVVDESVRERAEHQEQQEHPGDFGPRGKCDDKTKCDGCPVKDIINMFK